MAYRNHIEIGNPANRQGTVFVLTHGGWHAPEHNLPLARAINRRGYPCILPRLDSSNVNLSFADDTKNVADCCEGIDDLYLVGHSRGNEPNVRLPQYIDAARIVGVMAISWAGPHHVPSEDKRLPFLPRLSEARRYSKPHESEMRKKENKVRQGIATYNKDMAEKIFWTLLRDPELIKMARDNLREQRRVKFDDDHAKRLPPEIPRTSLVGLHDKALNVPIAIVNNAAYFNKLPRIRLVDHSPNLSAIEKTADFIINEALKAKLVRYRNRKKK